VQRSSLITAFDVEAVLQKSLGDVIITIAIPLEVPKSGEDDVLRRHYIMHQ